MRVKCLAQEHNTVTLVRQGSNTNSSIWSAVHYLKIPVITSGLIQLHKGFWVGLYSRDGGGLINGKLFQNKLWQC